MSAVPAQTQFGTQLSDEIYSKIMNTRSSNHHGPIIRGVSSAKSSDTQSSFAQSPRQSAKSKSSAFTYSDMDILRNRSWSGSKLKAHHARYLEGGKQAAGERQDTLTPAPSVNPGLHTPRQGQSNSGTSSKTNKHRAPRGSHRGIRSSQSQRLQEEWAAVEHCRTMRRASEMVQHRLDPMYLLSGSNVQLQSRYQVNDTELERLREMTETSRLLQHDLRKMYWMLNDTSGFCEPMTAVEEYDLKTAQQTARATVTSRRKSHTGAGTQQENKRLTAVQFEDGMLVGDAQSGTFDNQDTNVDNSTTTLGPPSPPPNSATDFYCKCGDSSSHVSSLGNESPETAVAHLSLSDVDQTSQGQLRLVKLCYLCDHVCPVHQQKKPLSKEANPDSKRGRDAHKRKRKCRRACKRPSAHTSGKERKRRGMRLTDTSVDTEVTVESSPEIPRHRRGVGDKASYKLSTSSRGPPDGQSTTSDGSSSSTEGTMPRYSKRSKYSSMKKTGVFYTELPSDFHGDSSSPETYSFKEPEQRDVSPPRKELKKSAQVASACARRLTKARAPCPTVMTETLSSCFATAGSEAMSTDGSWAMTNSIHQHDGSPGKPTPSRKNKSFTALTLPENLASDRSSIIGHSSPGKDSPDSVLQDMSPIPSPAKVSCNSLPAYSKAPERLLLTPDMQPKVISTRSSRLSKSSSQRRSHSRIHKPGSPTSKSTQQFSPQTESSADCSPQRKHKIGSPPQRQLSRQHPKPQRKSSHHSTFPQKSSLKAQTQLNSSFGTVKNKKAPLDISHHKDTCMGTSHRRATSLDSLQHRGISLGSSYNRETSFGTSHCRGTSLDTSHHRETFMGSSHQSKVSFNSSTKGEPTIESSQNKHFQENAGQDRTPSIDTQQEEGRCSDKSESVDDCYDEDLLVKILLSEGFQSFPDSISTMPLDDDSDCEKSKINIMKYNSKHTATNQGGVDNNILDMKTRDGKKNVSETSSSEKQEDSTESSGSSTDSSYSSSLAISSSFSPTSLSSSSITSSTSTASSQSISTVYNHYARKGVLSTTSPRCSRKDVMAHFYNLHNSKSPVVSVSLGTLEREKWPLCCYSESTPSSHSTRAKACNVSEEGGKPAKETHVCGGRVDPQACRVVADAAQLLDHQYDHSQMKELAITDLRHRELISAGKCSKHEPSLHQLDSSRQGFWQSEDEATSGQSDNLSDGFIVRSYSHQQLQNGDGTLHDNPGARAKSAASYLGSKYCKCKPAQSSSGFSPSFCTYCSGSGQGTSHDVAANKWCEQDRTKHIAENSSQDIGKKSLTSSKSHLYKRGRISELKIVASKKEIHPSQWADKCQTKKNMHKPACRKPRAQSASFVSPATAVSLRGSRSQANIKSEEKSHTVALSHSASAEDVCSQVTKVDIVHKTKSHRKDEQLKPARGTVSHTAVLDTRNERKSLAVSVRQHSARTRQTVPSRSVAKSTTNLTLGATSSKISAHKSDNRHAGQLKRPTLARESISESNADHRNVRKSCTNQYEQFAHTGMQKCKYSASCLDSCSANQYMQKELQLISKDLSDIANREAVYRLANPHPASAESQFGCKCPWCTPTLMVKGKSLESSTEPVAWDTCQCRPKYDLTDECAKLQEELSEKLNQLTRLSRTPRAGTSFRRLLSRSLDRYGSIDDVGTCMRHDLIDFSSKYHHVENGPPTEGNNLYDQQSRPCSSMSLNSLGQPSLCSPAGDQNLCLVSDYEEDKQLDEIAVVESAQSYPSLSQDSSLDDVPHCARSEALYCHEVTDNNKQHQDRSKQHGSDVCQSHIWLNPSEALQTASGVQQTANDTRLAPSDVWENPSENDKNYWCFPVRRTDWDPNTSNSIDHRVPAARQTPAVNMSQTLMVSKMPLHPKTLVSSSQNYIHWLNRDSHAARHLSSTGCSKYNNTAGKGRGNTISPSEKTKYKNMQGVADGHVTLDYIKDTLPLKADKVQVPSAQSDAPVHVDGGVTTEDSETENTNVDLGKAKAACDASSVKDVRGKYCSQYSTHRQARSRSGEHMSRYSDENWCPTQMERTRSITGHTLHHKALDSEQQIRLDQIYVDTPEMAWKPFLTIEQRKQLARERHHPNEKGKSEHPAQQTIEQLLSEIPAAFGRTKPDCPVSGTGEDEKEELGTKKLEAASVQKVLERFCNDVSQLFMAFQAKQTKSAHLPDCYFIDAAPVQRKEESRIVSTGGRGAGAESGTSDNWSVGNCAYPTFCLIHGLPDPVHRKPPVRPVHLELSIRDFLAKTLDDTQHAAVERLMNSNFLSTFTSNAQTDREPKLNAGENSEQSCEQLNLLKLLFASELEDCMCAQPANSEKTDTQSVTNDSHQTVPAIHSFSLKQTAEPHNSELYSKKVVDSLLEWLRASSRKESQRNKALNTAKPSEFSEAWEPPDGSDKMDKAQTRPGTAREQKGRKRLSKSGHPPAGAGAWKRNTTLPEGQAVPCLTVVGKTIAPVWMTT